MAQRSVQIIFVNQTSQTLVLVSDELAHGIWGTTPPQTIQPNSTGNWESESQGFATGVQGNTIYSFQSNSSTTITLTWDNPFLGPDGFPPGTIDNPAYTLKTDVLQDGNNATIKYTLTGA